MVMCPNVLPPTARCAHHCLVSNLGPTCDKVASNYRLGDLFLLGIPVSPNTDNWLVMNLSQYGM